MTAPHEKLNNYEPRHLHNIMEECFKGRGYADPRDHMDTSNLFEIRSRNTLANKIRDTFDSHAIDVAHYKLIEVYKSRGDDRQYYRKGRPAGAKNRNKGSTQNINFDALNEITSIDYDSAEETEVFDDSFIKEQEYLIDTQSTNPQMLDASKFALKTELKSVATALEKALRGYCETNFDKVFTLTNQHSDQINTHIEQLDILAKRIDNIQDHRPTIVELTRPELPNIELGVQHKNFPLLLKMCAAALRNGSHLNIWLPGPAGTGKSTAAENVATALECDFYTNGKLQDAFEILGYRDANGNYQTTQFRQAFEKGGIYLADEIDGSMPDALLAFNGALANGHCAFPDKVVKRHPNFIFIGAANTTGTGGTMEYIGRFKQDAAFLDRFVIMPWPIDLALEDALCANKDWLERVRYVRNRLEHSSIKGHLITPRATLYGEALLAAGLDQEQVETATLRKGLSDAQWGMIR